MKHILLLSAFLTGFSAIALEVLWTRVMVMVVGGSVYAFTIVLVAFLLGIAIGSTAFSIFIRILTNERRMGTNEIVWFAIVQLFLGASVIFTIPALGELPFVFLEGFRGSTPAFGSLMLHETFLALRMMILPTLLMGVSLPLLISSLRHSGERSDSRIPTDIRDSGQARMTREEGGIAATVGKIYAANTFGGVLGALAAGFFIIPIIGVQKGILAMGIVYMIVGVVIFLYANKMRMGQAFQSYSSSEGASATESRSFSSRQARTIISIVVLLVAVGTVLVGLKMSPWDPQVLSSGFYKDPSAYADADKTEISRKLKSTEILYGKEGISAHVAVTRGKDGVLTLKINGKADGSTGSDMENHILLGHLPMLLHPSAGSGPKSALVVGLGSGITLGSILSHPVSHVDAIEIEEKVVEAARYFNKYSNNALGLPPSCHPGASAIGSQGDSIPYRPSGSRVQNDKDCLTAVGDPRVRLIIADGRNYLLGSGNKYDVITSEPSNPWLSGSSKLFTKEYFQLLAKGIKKDGVVLQWINLYAIDISGLKSVIAAYKEVFPQVVVFGMPSSNDLALIGANKPIKFDLDLLSARLADEKVASDFGKVNIKEPFEILAYFVMGDKELKKLVGNTPPNTDNNPYVEFSAPKYLYAPIAVNPWRVIVENLSPIESVIARSSSVIARSGTTKQSQSLEIATLPSVARNDKELLKDAEDFRRSRLLTQLYSIEKNIGEGIKEGEKALKIDPDNTFIKEKLAEFYFTEGLSFFNQSVYGKAINALTKSLELKKTAEAYFNLGQSYGWDGDLEKARESYEKGVKLDPEFEIGWQWLGQTNQELGDLNRALAAYQKTVELNPKNKEGFLALGQLYILRRDFGKAEDYLNRVLKLEPGNEKAEELMKQIP